VLDLCECFSTGSSVHATRPCQIVPPRPRPAYRYPDLMSDLFDASDTHRFRELRYRLSSRRQVRPTGAMGYGRTGGLIATTAASICEHTRIHNRLSGRNPGFPGQCQAQGKNAYLFTPPYFHTYLSQASPLSCAP